jgi:outer membrane protein OmpA-like peptidoglycan-associated protein
MNFDKFEFLDKSEEERRLGNFATLLKGWSEATGYIVGYTGKGGGEDGLSRAYRVKDFVTKFGVSQHRLIVLIGAPREESTVELWWINFPKPQR